MTVHKATMTIEGDRSVRYDNGDVSVGNDFGRFGTKSCAIDKINSVDF